MPARIHVAAEALEATARHHEITRPLLGDRAKHLPLLPPTRGDCAPGGALHQRPCPYTQCEHHGFRLANERSIQHVTETCSLDVIDRDGATLEEVAAVIGITRERVRQIEERALAKIAKAAPFLAESIANGIVASRGATSALRRKAEIQKASRRRRRLEIVDENELEGDE